MSYIDFSSPFLGRPFRSLQQPEIKPIKPIQSGKEVKPISECSPEQVKSLLDMFDKRLKEIDGG